VIIARGHYLLSEEGKLVKQEYWHIMCFERKKRKENFTLEVRTITGNKFSNILEWIFRNLKNL